MKKYFLFATFLCLLQPASILPSELPVVIHYKLETRFNLKKQEINVQATLLIKNLTNKPHAKIPFLLYRLLTVENVYNHLGKQLSFRQNVVQLPDLPSLQAREVNVDLPFPLQPKDSVTIALKYSGMIFGYPEVMAYVRDRIDENYSLLRPDTYAYPILTEATYAGSLAANDTKFTYLITATVPKGYRAVCGGELVDSQMQGDNSTFIYRSKVPTWRIDIAVARFSVLTNPDYDLVVYHMPDDSIGSQRVIEASKNVIKLYSRMFGRPESYKGYSIIQIPDGWGSQAGDYYFLQTSAAFKDSSRISEVYHEIGHTWNATPSSDVQRCRYFDEAFASFFEALAIRSFVSKAAFEDDMEKSRDLFVRWAQYDRQVFDTPISDYGAKELGRHLYTKGAWSLYVLYRLVGEKAFSSIIRNMLIDFNDRAINFSEFQKLCERVTGRNLHKFFQEWIYGIESSKLLIDKVSIADIVRRY